MTRTIAPALPRRMLRSLAGWLAGAALLIPTLAGAGANAGKAPASARTAPAARAAQPGPATHKPPPHRPATTSDRARKYFQAAWGVDRMRVSRVASGTLIRFTYRVTDPAQAAPLRDRNVKPVLYAQRTRAVLSVPIMEKIGPLRPAGTLEAGREYWIAFSNKGNLVKPGDRVNVIVGRFHVDGLLVD